MDDSWRLRAERKGKSATNNCLIIEIIIPLMCLLEFLQLVHAGRNGGIGLGGVGGDIAVGVVLRASAGAGVVFDIGRVVRLPPGKRLPNVEAHGAADESSSSERLLVKPQNS